MLKKSSLVLSVICAVAISSCAEVSVPDARNVKIPTPIGAEERAEAINERPDSVMYLPLGADILVPERIAGDALPDDEVGPFELRSETLAGALQLILADYDVSIAFETDEGLTRKVTVANLKGPLSKVVNRVCSLADLYCLFEENSLIVKERQTFAVTLPPISSSSSGGTDGSTSGSDNEFIDDVMQGLSAIIGGDAEPVSDPTTRTIIYTATQRTAQLAENYFQRLRANTAMIVFETYIWEVALNSGNSTGIDWDEIEAFGKFNASIDFNGSVAADFTNPVSIGLPTTQALGANPSKLVEFLSQFGAVKTISQPQITVLSGSEAQLRVADTQNYVSEVASTISGDNTTTSVSTDSVDSGFTLTISSSWDKSTVYSNVNINLTNVVTIDDFDFDTDSGGGSTTIQLPQTTERELSTQIRVRPGDSVLIAGLVRETDNFDSSGPGFMEPILPTSRTSRTDNLELVVLLRPRVIVYTSPESGQYQEYVKSKQRELVSPKIREEWIKEQPRPSPLKAPAVKSEVKEPVNLTPTPKKAVKQSEPSPTVVEEAIVEPVVEPELVSNPEPIAAAPEIIEPNRPPLSRATSSYVSRASDYESTRPSFAREPSVVSVAKEPLSRVIEETSAVDDYYASLPEDNPSPYQPEYLAPQPSQDILLPAVNVYGEDTDIYNENDISPSSNLYGDYRPNELRATPSSNVSGQGNIYEKYEYGKNF